MQWSNDERLTFPRTVPADASPARISSDFDSRALELSYCANGPWDFANSSWYKGPPRGWEQPNDAPAPVPFAPSMLDKTGKAFVYCDNDRRTPEERASFCKGSTDGGPSETKPEGYITHFGVRPGFKTDIGDVCHKKKTGAIECIIYANTTTGNFKTFQSIIDAFPDDPSTIMTIHAVPLSEQVVSRGILQFMTSVSTLYYNDPGIVGPDAYIESSSSNGGILGNEMGISYKDSKALFPGLCHSQPTAAFFSTLYATIETFRAGTDSPSFQLVNFDGISQSDSFILDVPEEQVYPAHVEDQISFGSRIVSIKSAFTKEVAQMASNQLKAKVTDRPQLKARNFRFAGLVDPLQGCTRIVLSQPNITLAGLEFEQGGLCTQLAPESERVPIIAGGSRVENLQITDSVCIDCTAGLLSVRGGDPVLGTGAVAANVDVENVFVHNTEFLWTNLNGDDKCISERLSSCQNATLPGVETSFARIVGSPIVTNCPVVKTSTETKSVSEFCDLVIAYPTTKLRHAQFPGRPIASLNSKTGQGDTECSDTCNPGAYTDYDVLYSSADLKPCCDGLDQQYNYTCPADGTVYKRAHNVPPSSECSYANCLWNKMSDQRNFKPEWVDVVIDLEDAEIPDKLDQDLCRAFWRLCYPVCEDGQTGNCNVCLGKDAFTEHCDTFQDLAQGFVANDDSGGAPSLSDDEAIKLIRENPIQPPCADTGYALFTNYHKITSSDQSTFSPDVLADFFRSYVAGRTCSALGCPRIVNHTTSGPLSANVTTCVATDIPKDLRQSWFVADSANDRGLPSFDTNISITSPGSPISNFPSPFELDAGKILSGAEFQLSNAYNSARSTGIFMAQIRLVVGTGDERTSTCLTRNATRIMTGTEPGGILTAEPCTLQNPAQDFLFVRQRELGAWRIQIPDDPFMCITSQTDPTNLTCANETSAIVSPSGSPLCHQVYPHTTESTSIPRPLLMPCFPCAVGVDTEGTGMGPVVSSVIDLPSIVRPAFEFPEIEHVQFVPLSTTNTSLVLSVNLKTGMCLKFAPTTSTPSFAEPEVTGVEVAGEVACSLLEGAPVEQLEQIAGEPVCDDAAGLMVAPCGAKTGGLSFVDGTYTEIKALCTRLGENNRVNIESAGGGKNGQIECVNLLPSQPTGQESEAKWAINIIARGFGFRDKDTLYAVGPNPTTAEKFNSGGTFLAFVSKLIWQPHASGETPASAPIVGPTTEVLNVTALFGLFGDSNLYNVYAAGISSATAAYALFAIEIVIIVSASAYHLYFLFRKPKPAA